MRKLSLIIMDSIYFEHANAFERALKELNANVEVIRIPYFRVEELTISKLRELKTLIREKSKTGFLMFCPGTAEFYIPEAHKLFVFSAYKHWHQPGKVTVIPHVWTAVKAPASIKHLKWADKPPLRIGFMGSSYSAAKLANLVLRSPSWMRSWFLSGAYLKAIDVLAIMYQLGFPLKYLNTFPRFQTLQTLREKQPSFSDVELEIVDLEGFGGTELEKSRYVDHLERMTYIVCPRGSENFSIRVYEALKYGRIPVIIDTDMVLPKEIDWNRVSVRVPYDSLDKIYEIILHDYKSRSTQEFIERQQLAFSTMNELQSMRWLVKLLKEVIGSSAPVG